MERHVTLDTVDYVVITSAVWCALLIVVRRTAYKCGIWDGAFNQFLPHVRREMRSYDPHRAAEILGDAA